MKKLLLTLSALTTSTLLATVVESGRNVTVTGQDNALCVSNAEVQIDLRQGASLALKHTVPVFVHGDNATLSTEEGGSWTNKVVLWLDASVSESFGWERYDDKETGARQYTTGKDGKKYPTINRWYDRRGTNQTYAAMNNRGTAYATTQSTHSIYPSLMPYVVTNEVTGLPYVCFYNDGSSPRRIDFYQSKDMANAATNDSVARYNIPYKFAAIVFGSQDGGGQAILHQLKRGGWTSNTQAFTKDDPIFGVAYPTWVDGESVDPTTTGLNGDWQTICYGGGIYGFTSQAVMWSYKGPNGGNYSEIILLSTLPTDAERRAIEEYLQAKWGTKALPAPTPSADKEVRLFGTGTLSVPQGGVALGGTFAGTVTVAAGAVVAFTDDAFAPTNPAPIDVGAYDKHAGVWYDPDVTNSICKYSGCPEPYRDLSVGEMFNLHEPDRPFVWGQQTYLLYGSSRTPSQVMGARGHGSVHNWLEYDSKKTLCTVGCCLRMGQPETMTGTNFWFQTGFMVLDTSQGGGTPFLGVNLGADSSYLNARSKASDPIVCVGSEAETWVHHGVARLNGYDNGKVAESRWFNSRPELLTMSYTEAFPLRCLGSFGNTSADNMLIHGESIFYRRLLTDQERNDTEAYLMNKWLGITPSGYGDPTETTVAGAGHVLLVNRPEHPGVTATFTGSVSMPSAVIDFLVTTNAVGATIVRNPLAASGATLETPDSVTIRLRKDFPESPETGTYVLIDVAQWTGGASVVLDTANFTTEDRKRMTLSRLGNRVELKVIHPGLTVGVF